MKIINVAVAGPNFMKIAPLMDAYKGYPSIHPMSFFPNGRTFRIL